MVWVTNRSVYFPFTVKINLQLVPSFITDLKHNKQLISKEVFEGYMDPISGIKIVETFPKGRVTITPKTELILQKNIQE